VTVNDVAAALPQIVFTTSAQTLTTNLTSGTMTIQRRTSGGTPQTAGSLTVSLATNGAGAFRNTGDTANIPSVTIANGSSSASFRYRGTAVGTPTLTASAVGYTAGTQMQTVALPKLVFTTPPRSTTTSVSTGTITVQRQNADGTARTSGSLTVNLATTTPGGFRNLADSAVISSVAIASGSSTASFRYASANPGTPTMTVSATGYTSATQGVTIIGLPKLVFTTAPQSTRPNVVSGLITVRRQTFGGTPQTSGALVVNLARTGSGAFRNVNNNGSITVVVIPNGSSTASFRFLSGAIGTRTLTVSATGYTSASQVLTIDTPPSISSFASSYTTPRNTARTINFTVGDADSGGGAVTLSATSSNTNVVFNSGITFPDNSGSSRSIRIAPRSGRSGTTTITITASDGLLTTTRTFTLTVL
jgi:hypothetical protein